MKLSDLEPEVEVHIAAADDSATCDIPAVYLQLGGFDSLRCLDTTEGIYLCVPRPVFDAIVRRCA
jgi:hypothetical protein